MTIEQQLIERSGTKCELCVSADALNVYNIPPDNGSNADKCLYVCSVCISQLEKKSDIDFSHWTCLRDSMWSEVPAVQVVSWRMLNRLRVESWASDAIDMMYLDEDNMNWAKASGDHLVSEGDEKHRDSLGALLQTGDSVTLIKSLDVKGSHVNARIGTLVKNIKIVTDNTEQIEGKIEGQQIVILTKFVRKA